MLKKFLIFLILLSFSAVLYGQTKLLLSNLRSPRSSILQLAITNDSNYSFTLYPQITESSCAVWTLDGESLAKKVFLHKQSVRNFHADISHCNIFYGMFQITFGIRPHGFGLGYSTQKMQFLCSFDQGACFTTPTQLKFTSPHGKRAVCVRDLGRMDPIIWQIYEC